jgi:hydroxymethylpyrimidine kinase/phosphomethylpyrimidine kinase
VAAQIDAIFSDINVAAVKIGMLGSGAVAEVVAERLAFYKPASIVLDPVLVATSGDALGTSDVVGALWRHLIPLATLVTPNIPEAAQLADAAEPVNSAEVQRLARVLCAKGAKAVLIKGGHMEGASADDLLVHGPRHHVYSAPRVATRNTHGTGCTLSSAIAAYLAHGLTLEEAIEAAKTYLTNALIAAERLKVGHGHGPLDHFHGLR